MGLAGLAFDLASRVCLEEGPSPSAFVTSISLPRTRSTRFVPVPVDLASKILRKLPLVELVDTRYSIEGNSNSNEQRDTSQLSLVSSSRTGEKSRAEIAGKDELEFVNWIHDR